MVSIAKKGKLQDTAFILAETNRSRVRSNEGGGEEDEQGTMGQVQNGLIPQHFSTLSHKLGSEASRQISVAERASEASNVEKVNE